MAKNFERKAKKIRKELLFEIIIFAVAVASIINFFRYNLLLAATLMALWLMGIVFWHKKHDVVFFVTGALIGPIAEIICVHFGAWRYANPSFLGIPAWLPFAWGLSAMLIVRISETFVKIESRR